MVQRAVTLSLAQRGKRWVSRIATVIEDLLAHVEELDPATQDLDQLEKLVRLVRGLDDVGRRTFGLDEESPAAGWARKCIDV